MSDPDRPRARNLDDVRTTAEVGDEGGSPGDVEVDVDRQPGTGRESAETWKPDDEHHEVIVRDENGVGRRSP